MNRPNVLVTGCAGFIGSHVTDRLIQSGYNVVGFDCFTYAAKLSNLNNVRNHHNFSLQIGSINDLSRLEEVVSDNRCEWIINLAAETHVDNSIKSCKEFLTTNILGVHSVLEVCRRTGVKLLHFSTDEVYGVADGATAFDEGTPLSPRNPYSASKAAADHLIQAYRNTHGTNHLIVRPSNNFGIRQHSEKFIPTILRSIENGKKIPLYGNGEQIREWTNAEETAKAVLFLLENAPLNETYNITSGTHMKNKDVILCVCQLLGLNYDDVVEYISDRPGHDFRYSISSKKLNDLGYILTSDFITDLKKVIQNDFSGLWNKTRVD